MNTKQAIDGIRQLIWLPVMLAAGCAHGGADGVDPPLPVDVGPPVSSYQIPAGSPRGRIHLVSLGRETLATGTGQPRVFLHLRVAAVNGSDNQIWTLDPREQLLRDGDRMLSPSFSESSTGQPAITLAQGARGYLDLYYPLWTTTGKEPARVALAWRLRRGGQMFAQATEFERSHQEAGYAYYQAADQDHTVTALGSGSWWWNDYYFWQDERGWWPYRQRDFAQRYPHHREQWWAQRQHLAEQARRENELVTRRDDGIYWRGPRTNESHDPVSSTSSWRGTPVSESVSSSPVTDSSGGTSSGGGGDGKSSWRGGSGR